MAIIDDGLSANKGKTTCNRNILLSVISLATKEISGVSELVDTPSIVLKRMFKNKDSKGVKVKISPNGKITVDVYIKVFSGVNVPDICFRVQENIKNNIASMVDLKTGKINVHIVGVNFVQEKEEGAI
ncbi:MAG: Asp23/Gls24 family envelope stress response protein [Clostridiales bacterium]|nr:Asp23/Gls24 family envelope stress response protein [Clostridiales bacterium]